MRPSQLTFVVPDRGLLPRYVEQFISAKRAAGRQPDTIRFYRTTLDQYAAIAGWPPTVESVRAFLTYATGGAATRHAHYRALRAFLNWCESEGLLLDNPIRHVEEPQKPSIIPHAVPFETLVTLFGAIDAAAANGDILATRDAAMLRLAYCGLRGGELVRVTVGDLDLGYNAVTVQESKTHSGRVVYYGDVTADALRRWLRVLHPSSRWLFVSNTSMSLQPLTRNGAYQALRRWCKRAGVEPFRLHDLRHSYARHALRAGIDVELVQRQLGHTSPTTTLMLYARSEDPMRREVHQRLSPADNLPTA